jgi:hypothetical protein
MSSPKKTISRVFYGFLIILFALYILFQAKNLLIGPVISIDEPKDGATLTYEVITVKGTAKNVSYIYLDNKQIYVDTDGHFNEKLIAPAGYSIIELSAQDKFGRKTKKFIRIVLQKSKVEIPPLETATTTNNKLP